MRLGFKQFIESLLQRTMLPRPEPELEAATVPDMVSLIEQAKREWKYAANYFDNVSDPELVDHAILLREAAERRYMYLLKQAKLTKTRDFAADHDFEQISASANEPA
jgi:hypothetical protein